MILYLRRKINSCSPISTYPGFFTYHLSGNKLDKYTDMLCFNKEIKHWFVEKRNTVTQIRPLLNLGLQVEQLILFVRPQFRHTGLIMRSSAAAGVAKQSVNDPVTHLAHFVG